MHPLVHVVLWSLLDPSTSPSNQIPRPPDNTLKVAIVGAIGLVLATAITAMASTFRRDPSAHGHNIDDVTRRYIAGLERDRRDYGKVREEHSHLREACLQRGLNPDDLIHEQEQHP